MPNEADCMKEGRYCDEAESKDCCEPEERKISKISSSSPFSCTKDDSRKASDFETLEDIVARIAEYVMGMRTEIHNTYENILGEGIKSLPAQSKPESSERPQPPNRIVGLSVRLGDIEKMLININDTRKEINSMFE